MIIMVGVGPYFWVHQWERVLYPECAAESAEGSMDVHRQAQHKTVWAPQWKVTT